MNTPSPLSSWLRHCKLRFKTCWMNLFYHFQKFKNSKILSQNNPFCSFSLDAKLQLPAIYITNMPRKNTPKPAKRAKLSIIQRFLKNQVEQTSTLASRASSHSCSNQPCRASMPILNQQQSNLIPADNPLNASADFVENDEAESQEISCEAISRSPLPNEQRPFSEVSGSSDILTNNRCSPATVSPSSPLATKSKNILNFDKPNHHKVPFIPAQILSKRTLHFQSKWYEDFEWIHYNPELKKSVFPLFKC